MRNQCYFGRKVVCGLFSAALFFVVTPLWSAELHGLHHVTRVQSDEKIAALKNILDQNPSDYGTLKALGIIFHMRARKDAKAYAPRAVEFLSRAHESNRNDNETLCYLGSATTMMAQTTWNPMKKMAYVNRGTGLMDKAVKRDPDNVTVRMTRALNSKNLPSFLERGNLALDDFEYLADLIEKNPESLTSIKKIVYTNLVELYEKNGDDAKAAEFRKMSGNL